MKKILLLAAVLLVSSSLYAERLYLIQGTYLGTSRTYTDGTNNTQENYGEFGLSFTTFSGQGLGFYSSASFLVPVDYSLYYNDTEVSGYDKDYLDEWFDSMQLGLDMLLGVGFLAPINPTFSILVGGGLHFNGLILFSSNAYVDNYLAYNIGPGAAANAIMYMTDSLNLNVGFMAAWDMLEFITLPELAEGIDAEGGITWAVSAGLGFSY